MKRKYKIIYTILSLIIVAIISFSIHYKSIESKNSNIFSQEEWNKNTNTRAYMIDELLLRYDFIGMSKSEVINLLGENGLTVDSKTLRYETHGGILSDEILMFIIDKNDKVTYVGIAN